MLYEENLKTWEEVFQWEKHGDEWSEGWGGPEAQWFGTLYPRIHQFLPARTILEIAPGHGRWTNYLRRYADCVIGVDLAPSCTSFCQKRFAEDPKLAFHTNDGKTLPMIPDQSIDFLFSFDSLVHAEGDSLQSYCREIKRVLVPHGVAILHHSNLGDYEGIFKFSESLSPKWRDKLVTLGVLDKRHERSLTVSASLVRQWCEQAGVTCVAQELVNWAGKRLIDCISWIVPTHSKLKTVILRNPNFTAEADRSRTLANVKLPK